MRTATRILVLGLVLPAFVTGCERTEPSGTAAPVAADPAALCDAAAPLLVVVPREFVGTEEHVALYDDLAAVAPEDLQDDIALLRAHYEDDVSPANPDSQDFKNFPGDVQEAALRLSGELTDRC